MAKGLKEINAARPYFIPHGKARTLPIARASPGNDEVVDALEEALDPIVRAGPSMIYVHLPLTRHYHYLFPSPLPLR
jgi:hypothetical protein